MVPQTQKRKPRNSSKVNLIISIVFHALVVGTLAYFAARQGLLGKTIKKIAVQMVKEKPPEKPKEPEKPKQDLPKPEQPKTIVKTDIPKEAPRQVPQAAPPADAPTVAPAPVAIPSFSFEGGKAVVSTSNPAQLYKGLLEYAFRSKWDRPEDMDDSKFVAEVEVSVDGTGAISDPVWKKLSNNKRWDDSVRQAVAATKSLDRPPPKNFPPRVIIRFDTVETEPALP